MPGTDLWQHADRVWHHAFAAQPLPPLWLVVGSGALALAAVASARVWPITRTVVTIVHEGGHAMVALATGQRRVRVRLYRDTAGETVSASGAAGVGIALTAAAGYPAPSLAGLGAAAMLAAGHVTGMLLLGLVLLAGLAVAVRNPYGMVAVLATGATLAVICLYASALIQAGTPHANAGRSLGHDLWHLRPGCAGCQRPLAGPLPLTACSGGPGLGHEHERRQTVCLARGARRRRQLIWSAVAATAGAYVISAPAVLDHPDGLDGGRPHCPFPEAAAGEHRRSEPPFLATSSGARGERRQVRA